MRRRIVRADRLVPTFADDFIAQHDKRAHGDFVGLFRVTRELQRAAHPGLVAHSHSIVAGGLPEMSYTTREMPATSLMMRLEMWPSTSYGSGAQFAVMKST